MQNTDFKRTKCGACRRSAAQTEAQQGPLQNDTTTTRSAECVVVWPFAMVVKVVVSNCKPLTGKYFSTFPAKAGNGRWRKEVAVESGIGNDLL